MKTVEVYYNMMIDALYMACVLTKIRKTTLNVQSWRDLEDWADSPFPIVLWQDDGHSWQDTCTAANGTWREGRKERDGNGTIQELI